MAATLRSPSLVAPTPPPTGVVAKAPTGIAGLDEITDGGLPRARPTLICGGPGCGKTLLGIEFLVRGALEFNEPGVFVAFEESRDELTRNVASLGFDLEDLVDRRQLLVDHIHLERSEIEETGEYDLEGLFIRLGHAIDCIGARRVVLDTLETLFAGIPNQLIVRAELRRLFRWLKAKGVAAIITAERGQASLTQHGLEEYVSDCVILLDHRMVDQVSTRRLRVLKYRGSRHGTNEYPFLIGDNGITVLPVTSIGLQHAVSRDRVSTGIDRLDSMLGGDGIYRGTTLLISGTAGTGKTSIAATFADAACRRRERVLFVSFEESEQQIARNMQSVGLDLARWIKDGLLRMHPSRPSMYGLETHLAVLHREVKDFNPDVVILDPINAFDSISQPGEAKSMLTRLSDFLKNEGITSVFTSQATLHDEGGETGISSLIDTWILLRNLEGSGERNRGLYVLKSRGMAHSNQIREFTLGGTGARLLDVHVGPDGVLAGSARLAQEAAERAAQLERRNTLDRMSRDAQRRRDAFEAKLAALRAEYAAESEESERLILEGQAAEQTLAEDRLAMSASRSGDVQEVAS